MDMPEINSCDMPYSTPVNESSDYFTVKYLDVNKIVKYTI